MNTETEFNAMVNNLAKKGSEIKKSLDAKKCHLLHMAIGIQGEVNEACAALRVCDNHNLHEEIGDLHFYIRGLVKDIDGIEYTQNPTFFYLLYQQLNPKLLMSLIVTANIYRHCQYALFLLDYVGI